MNKNIVESPAYILNNDYSKQQLNINEYGYEHSPILLKSLADMITSSTISKYSSVKEDGEARLKKNIIELNRSSGSGLDFNNIIISNSGDINILSIFRLMKKKSNEMIQFVPTYSQYETIARMEGWRVNNININDKRHMQRLNDKWSKIIDKKKAGCVIFICNPNNPTGAKWSFELLTNMFSKFKRCMFVVDETYIDFSNHRMTSCMNNDAVDSVINMVNDYTNVIVMRSFSKAYGLAGLRLSYMASNRDIISQLKKLISHKDVIEISKTAGSLVLENINFYRLKIQQMFEDKNKLIDLCKQFKIIYMDADSNFICLKTKKNMTCYLYDIFQGENILIKTFANCGSNKFMADWIRITIQYNTVDTIINIIKKHIYLFKTRKQDTGFIDGCFDGFHYGHIMALSYAKENCKWLKCGTHVDEEVYRHKYKKPVFRCFDREFMLKYCIFVDELVAAVPYNTDELVLRNNNADMFHHGDDGIDKYPLLQLNKANKLYIYPRTQYISTTDLKERIIYYQKNKKASPGLMQAQEVKEYLGKCYNRVKKMKPATYKMFDNYVIVTGNFDMFSRRHVEQLISIQKQYNKSIFVSVNGDKYPPAIFSIDEQKIMIESCKVVSGVINNTQIDSGAIAVEIDVSIDDILSELVFE